VGEIAAELMEELAEDFGDDATLGVVMVVAEVEDATDPDDPTTTITLRCSDGREWIQTGFLESATREVRRWGMGAEEKGED
jgi:hypothetical protein